MFSSSLRATLIALAASAIAVTASPSLSLKVTGADSVTDVNNLKVATTVTNTGADTLKLLNDPRGVLNKLPTNTFKVINSEGSAAKFAGAKVKYLPAAAITNGKEDAFTVLTPGQSVTVEHNLGDAYNFTNTGAGDYTFEASNLFYVVDSENNAVPVYANSETAHTAKVAGKLAVARRNLEKRASYVGCSSTQQSGLVSAASAAQSYAASALSYANAHTSATTRYTTWFGTYTSSRHSTITSHYSLISSGSYSSFTYDCTCTESGTYAYVYPDQYGTIYLCGAFWAAPNTGTDSRGGTLIHEASHFTKNGGTDDYVYGQTGAKSLAQSNPDQAVFNADNHEYFAENNPAQS